MDPSSPETSALRNLGFFAHLPEGYGAPEQRTYVVLGLPRGGTTMVAKALEALGVFIGADADNAVGEDVGLAEAFESGDKRTVRSIIERYDAEHDEWGFKRPNIAAHLGKRASEFRNPHYVVVLRDILAIANRNRLSTFKEPFKDMRESLESMDRLLSFVEANADAPMFFLSYDRVIADPRRFVEAFAEFCGRSLTTKQTRAVLLAITPNDAYLDSARSDTFMGRVTGADATTVTGFFRYHNSEDTPPLDLYVNDEPVDADLAWSHMKIERKSGRVFEGDHAFTLTLRDGRELVRGDKVIVVADDRRRQRLRNCPYRVKI